MALRDRLESQVARKKYQPDVWSSLIRDALNDHSSDQIRDARVRDVFNRLLEAYPLASAQWVRYATYEFERSHYDRVEEIFSRALSNVRAVDLYKFYMDYIYKMNTTETGLPTSPHAHNTILQASEFVLNRVGIDKDSGTLWSQYLAYLKKQQPQSQWEEQQKIEGLRAAYHRAIVIPMDHLEQIWKEYDTFENSINRFTAKKLLADHSSAYMTARTAYREMRIMFDAMTALYSPGSLPAPLTWSDDEIAYLNKWKKYISWEKDNPLRLDDSAVEQRVAHAYRRAIAALWLYPEIWVEGGLYLSQSAAHKDEGVQYLKQATDVLPKSGLVHFAYAEHLEGQKKLDEMCQTFDQLTTTLQQTIEDLQSREERALNKMRKRVDYHAAQHERITGINKTVTDGVNDTADSQAPASKRVRITQDPVEEDTTTSTEKGPIPTDNYDSDVDSVLSEGDLQLEDLYPNNSHTHSEVSPNTTAVPDLGGVATHTTTGEDILFTELPVNTSADIAAYNRAVDKYRNQRLDLIRSRFVSQIEPLRRELSLAYIMYQRFLRRSKGTKPSRKLFSNISKSSHVTHHVFVASALLEYYFDKNVEIVGKIFQVGMNRFGKEPDYVVQYLDYLIRVNDDTNAQSVFERAVSTLPVEETKDIWNMYLEYQAAYGDLTALQQLETRYLAAFQEETIANRLMEKYSFLDLATVADVDMGMVHREPAPSGGETWKTTSPEDKGVTPAGSGTNGMEPGPVLPTRYDSVGYGAGHEPQGSRHASRRQLLASVHPERYPRPDISQWVPFKAVEEIQRRGTQPPYLEGSEEEFDGSSRLAGLKPPAHNTKDDGGPFSGTHPNPLSDYPTGHVPSGIRRGPSHSPGPGSSHEVELNTPWDVVNAFLQLLPPANHFTQPVFPVEEIVDRLQQSALPDVDLAHRSSLAAALQVTLTPDRSPVDRDMTGRVGAPPPTGYYDHHPGDYRGRDSGPRRGYHPSGSGRGGPPLLSSRFTRGSSLRGRGGPPRGHSGFRGRASWR